MPNTAATRTFAMVNIGEPICNIKNPSMSGKMSWDDYAASSIVAICRTISTSHPDISAAIAYRFGK
jgi:hypothetical protein